MAGKALGSACLRDVGEGRGVVVRGDGGNGSREAAKEERISRRGAEDAEGGYVPLGEGKGGIAQIKAEGGLQTTPIPPPPGGGGMPEGEETPNDVSLPPPPSPLRGAISPWRGRNGVGWPSPRSLRSSSQGMGQRSPETPACAGVTDLGGGMDVRGGSSGHARSGFAFVVWPSLKNEIPPPPGGGGMPKA